MDELSTFDKSKIFTEYPPQNEIEQYDPNITIYKKLEKDKEDNNGFRKRSTSSRKLDNI